MSKMWTVSRWNPGSRCIDTERHIVNNALEVNVLPDASSGYKSQGARVEWRRQSRAPVREGGVRKGTPRFFHVNSRSTIGDRSGPLRERSSSLGV